jgi:hypothetical protein
MRKLLPGRLRETLKFLVGVVEVFRLCAIDRILQVNSQGKRQWLYIRPSWRVVLLETLLTI